MGVEPDEWRGLVRGRRAIYVRYDAGHLTIHVGEPGMPLAGLKDECVFSHFFDDPPMRLGYRHLKDLTRGVIRWPAHELPETDRIASTLRKSHMREQADQVRQRSTALEWRVYIDRGRLMIPRNQTNAESLFTTSPDHDCRRMGCTVSAHVVLRR